MTSHLPPQTAASTPALPPKKPGLAIIGAGAFGEFCVPHLRQFFDVRLCDPRGDLVEICTRLEVQAADLKTAAEQDVVLLAVPLGQLRSVARAVAPHLRPRSLVVDVCSVKAKPLRVLAEELPPDIDIVGTHPLFGPQSGRNGIEGLRVAVCAERGRRALSVERFLRRKLGLAVIRTSAEQHDRQMAYVQGLTHLIARIMITMDVPKLDHTTTTFSHLESMVDMVRHDSDELFRSIVTDNPFVDDVMTSFVRATKDVLQPFSHPSNADALA